MRISNIEKMVSMRSLKKGRKFIKNEKRLNESKKRARKHARRVMKLRVKSGDFYSPVVRYDDWTDW